MPVHIFKKSAAKRHIEHEGNKWVLYDSTGNKKLGEHDTKEDAEKQEAAIKAHEADEKSRAQEPHVGVPEAEKFPKTDQNAGDDDERDDEDDDEDTDTKPKNQEDAHDVMNNGTVGKGGKPANEKSRAARSFSGERRTTFNATKVGIETRMVKRDDGTEESQRMIVGYAARYYDEKDGGTEYWLYPDVVERIAPGAFDEVVRNAGKPGGCDVLALFNHNCDYVLGRVAAGTCRLSVDQMGLRFEIDPPQTQMAEAVIEGIKRNDIGGCSFAFDVDEHGQDWQDVRRPDGEYYLIRTLTNFADLMDVSVCSRAAYGATSVGVRSEHVSDETRAKADEMRAKRHGDADAVALRIRLAEMA